MDYCVYCMFFFFQTSVSEDKDLSVVLETFYIIAMYEHKVTIPYFLNLLTDNKTFLLRSMSYLW